VTPFPVYYETFSGQNWKKIGHETFPVRIFSKTVRSATKGQTDDRYAVSDNLSTSPIGSSEWVRILPNPGHLTFAADGLSRKRCIQWHYMNCLQVATCDLLSRLSDPVYESRYVKSPVAWLLPPSSRKWIWFLTLELFERWLKFIKINANLNGYFTSYYAIRHGHCVRT
jgi:hypothetical protein